jgi:hypothetical protein
MNTPKIDHSGTELEREKWRDELKLREREIAIKEREQLSKEEELRLTTNEQRRSRWTNPLVLAVFAAAVAAAGNAGVAWLTAHEQRAADIDKGEQARALDESKSEADRILEVIKTNNDPDKAATNLKFLVDAGLIQSRKTKGPLQTYLETRKQGEGATLPAPAATSTPPPPPRPTFQIDCTLRYSGSLLDIAAPLIDFLKAPPFGFNQITISQRAPAVYLTWDPDAARQYASLVAFLMLVSSSTLEHIEISPRETGASVRAILPLSGLFGFLPIDKDAALNDLTARLRRKSADTQCRISQPDPTPRQNGNNDRP